jgi:osmoprotectant transport system ATP-binding protein
MAVTLVAVRFNSVSKNLGGVQVLDHVDLEIPMGTVTAILGESGSGKSTLLNHINGLLVPDKGRVEVLGSELNANNMQAMRRRMGYAVQAVGLFPHLRLYENITLAATLFGGSAQATRDRARRLMALLKLGDELENRYPHELSGGQQQRAGLARALMLHPDLLLLDEPFSGVDPIARVNLHAEFQNLLAAEPATTILVTHDVREAVRLASQFVILQSGQVLQQGSADSVRSSPATEFVAQLFQDVS